MLTSGIPPPPSNVGAGASRPPFCPWSFAPARRLSLVNNNPPDNTPWGAGLKGSSGWGTNRRAKSGDAMGTQDAHQKDLAGLFAIYLNRGDRVRLVEYLVTHSNLPGPRGNLELAQAFAEEAAVRTGPGREKGWSLWLNPAGIARALTELRRLADDSRWRTREAAAMALQQLLRHHPQKTLARLKTWIADEHWLAMRAVAAGVAGPGLPEDHPRVAA